MKNHDPLVAIAAALLLGCGGGGASPLETASLAFDPSDVATARGSGVVILTLTDHAHIVDEPFLADLSGRIVLETWPEGAGLSMIAQAGDGALAEQKLVTVTPQAALDDRWYIVKLTSVPRAIVPLARLPDGTVGTRFRTGSHPRVASIQVCPVDATRTKLLLGCSEPVTFPGASEEIVTLAIAGNPSSCVQYGVQGSTYLFTCGGVPETASSVVVNVGPGSAGSTGVPMEPGSWTVGLSAPVVGGCGEVRPPL